MKVLDHVMPTCTATAIATHFLPQQVRSNGIGARFFSGQVYW